MIGLTCCQERSRTAAKMAKMQAFGTAEALDRQLLDCLTRQMEIHICILAII
jgi:hypothetical protein